MNLPEKTAQSIKRRLDVFKCQSLSGLGSGEPCITSRECRCGEFCSRNGVCQPATCDLSNAAICQSYPGYNAKYVNVLLSINFHASVFYEQNILCEKVSMPKWSLYASTRWLQWSFSRIRAWSQIRCNWFDQLNYNFCPSWLSKVFLALKPFKWDKLLISWSWISFRFTCQSNLCMPRKGFLKKSFNIQFETEGAPRPGSNNATNTTNG